VKEQLAGLKAEQKRVLRQQDELVDDLEELELERDELRDQLHKYEQQSRGASTQPSSRSPRSVPQPTRSGSVLLSVGSWLTP